jgi:ABC-type sugar transport system ATPase subunit
VLREHQQFLASRFLKLDQPMLGIEPYLGRKPAALSGGQRQRVAMGRAIVREPQAFLMDEPLSNLDAKLRVSMRASLSQLHERLGVTTVYVTHDQVEAMTLGQRVSVLRDGQLQQVDTPQALFDHPVNLFVAGFMGSPAMNFATAQLVRDAGPAVGLRGPPAVGASPRRDSPPARASPDTAGPEALTEDNIVTVSADLHGQLCG